MTCVDPTPVCYLGACLQCLPGTFSCVTNASNHAEVLDCDGNGSWASFLSCASSYSCDATTGSCVHATFHPRDLDFEVPALLRDVPEARSPGLRTRDVLDRAVGIAFG
jgi:hypothetical protein